jgi:hypothetical protein
MTSSRRFSLVITVFAVVSLIGLGGVAWALTRDGDEPTAPSGQPAGVEGGSGDFGTFFIDGSGKFVAPNWDDRALSDEQKEDDPSLNPAWAPFSTCLAEGGLEVRNDASQPFTQNDLDAVVERVNKDFPDREANKTIMDRGYRTAGGSAGTYLRCAYDWLLKSPQEVFELTGEPNDHYPPK